MTGLIFALAGALCVYGFYIYPRKNKRKCKVEVQATIEEIEEGNLSVNGESMYSPICSYYYNGLEYRNKVELNVRKYEIPVGKKITIRINQNNPNEVYVKSTGADSAMSYMGLFLGGLFIIMGLYMVVEDSRSNNVTDKVVDGGQSITQQTNLNSTNDKNTSKADRDIEESLKKIRESSNYVKIYGDDYSTELDDIDEAKINREIMVSTRNYMRKCKLVKDIDGMYFYLPKEFDLRTEGQDSYHYVHRNTESSLMIYYKDNDYGVEAARELLNDKANCNRILAGVTNNVYYNKRMFEICKARNVDGDYIDIACGVNEHKIIYIEYNHKLGTENIFNDMIKLIRY